MVPIRGEWHRFADFEQQLHYLRLWGLIPPKATQIRTFMVTDGYFGVPEPCKVVGFKDEHWAVIELPDGYHAIFGEYLAEQQPDAAQKLPRGMCFADILKEYIVLDIETTGFDRTKDEIIEIAAIRYRFGKEADSYHTLVKPSCCIPDDISDLTGIRDSDVLSAPELGDVIQPFLAFLGTAPLVGHNILTFDLPFINSRLPTEIANPVIDTLPMARGAFPLVHCHKLEFLKTEILEDTAVSHRALDDCNTTNRLLWACLSPRKYESNMNRAAARERRNRQVAPQRKSRRETKQAKPKYERVDIKAIKPKEAKPDKTQFLSGKNILFTGNLSIPREQAMQLAVDAGATLKSSVSRKLHYLVVGQQDPSLVGAGGRSQKELQAEALNQSGKASIQILDENGFKKLLKGELTHE